MGSLLERRAASAFLAEEAQVREERNTGLGRRLAGTIRWLLSRFARKGPRVLAETLAGSMTSMPTTVMPPAAATEILVHLATLIETQRHTTTPSPNTTRRIARRVEGIRLFNPPSRGLLILVNAPDNISSLSNYGRVVDFTSLVDATLRHARDILRGGIVLDEAETIHATGTEVYASGSAGLENLLPAIRVETGARSQASVQERVAAGTNAVRLSIGMAVSRAADDLGALFGHLLVRIDSGLFDETRRQILRELLASGRALVVMDAGTAVTVGQEIDWQGIRSLVYTDTFQSLAEAEEAVEKIGDAILEELATSGMPSDTTEDNVALGLVYAFSALLRHFSAEIVRGVSTKSSDSAETRYTTSPFALSPLVLAKNAPELVKSIAEDTDSVSSIIAGEIFAVAPYLASLDILETTGMATDSNEYRLRVSEALRAARYHIILREDPETGKVRVNCIFRLFEPVKALSLETVEEIEETLESGLGVGFILAKLPREEAGTAYRLYLARRGMVLGHLDISPRGKATEGVVVYGEPTSIRSIVNELREAGTRNVAVLTVADIREYVARDVVPDVSRALFDIDQGRAGDAGRKILHFLEIFSGRERDRVIDLLALVALMMRLGRRSFSLEDIMSLATTVGVKASLDDIDAVLLAPRIIIPEGGQSGKFVVAAGYVVNSPLVAARASILEKRLPGKTGARDILQAG